MIWTVLFLGLGLAIFGAMAGTALVSLSRLELTRAVARQPKGGTGSLPWLAGMEEDPGVPAPLSRSPTHLSRAAAAMALGKAHRTHGHLAAHLDPLGSEPVGDPALDPASLGLTPEVMAQIPAAVLRIAVPGETLADALPLLHEAYCGTIAYELAHISNHNERVWLRQMI